MKPSGAPWHARLLLLAPGRVRQKLLGVGDLGLLEETPNLWQIELGILRMWHRIAFRSETVGTCAALPVRANWRARLLAFRPLRFPFLLWERAITPWDLSGLLSSQAQIIRHLMCAHHDEGQFIYDLQLMLLYPGSLEALHQQLRRVIEEDTPRSRWLRDLTVYEGYHEQLKRGVERVLQGARELNPRDAQDPDISLLAYLRWCSAQPPTPHATWQAWRKGGFRFPLGVGAG